MVLASFSHQSIHFSDDAMMTEAAAKYFEGTIPIEFHDSTKCDACGKSPLWGAVYSCVQYSTAHADTADFCQSCLCADCSTSIKPCFCETFVNQSCQSNEASLCYISVHCRMHDGSMHQKANMPGCLKDVIGMGVLNHS